MNSSAVYQEELWQEQIGGKLVMMAPAAVNHVLVSGNIYGIFSSYLRGKRCTPFADGALVYLTDEDHFSPDFMIVCNPDIIRPDGIHGVPDLVVEVLSPSTASYDRSRKKDVYERCGVRELWIVSPTEKMVEQYFLRDGKFLLNETYALYPDWLRKKLKPDEQAAIVTEFRCSLYDDLTISLEDIFARVP